MRVIAGKFRSRLISAPKGVELRPTSDRVKESLFGILGDFVVGKEVLDLFSGTGNLGIEALSRGAKTCVFVDSNPRCIVAIKKNLESLGIKQGVNTALKDAFRYIKEAAKEETKFDLVFLDPPYYSALIKKSLILLDNYNIITHLSYVIAEHHKKDDLPEAKELKTLRLCRQEKYGGTILSFYKRGCNV